MEKNVHLYIGYMNNEQANKFNLKDNSNVHLMNLSNHIPLEDINDINCQYSELCVAYYVWKHQLKSDYISIGQHRRYITPINFERLNNNEVQVFPTLHHIEDNYSPYQYMIKDGFNDYIILSFIKYLLKNNLASRDKIYDVIYNQPFEISYFNVFACNWDIFNNICEFIFGFLQELMFDGTYTSFNDIINWLNDMSLSLENHRFIIDEKQLNCNFNWGRVNSHDRNVAAIYELLLPLYCQIRYSIFVEHSNKKLGIELLNFNKETIYNDIFNWISKNTFTGTLEYYIKTSKENMEFLENLVNENWYGLSSGNVHIVMKFPDDIIEMHINEYIDVDTPYDKLNIENIKTIS